MNQLRILDISNTDINKVDIDKLPRSVNFFIYSTEARPNCKLTVIIPQLDAWTWRDLHVDFIRDHNGGLLRKSWEEKGLNREITKEWIQAGVKPKDYRFVKWLKDIKKFTPQWILDNKDNNEYQNLRKRCNKFHWCEKCCQPNASENWCQFCQEKEWAQDLKQLKRQEMVEKFIRQQWSRVVEKSKQLKWIPYEELTDVKSLSEGGFGKIYKAKCDLFEKKVVLKSLNNSQNMTIEFLQETFNHTLLTTHKNRSHIVPCYGLSQDPATKNYLIVMEYMEGGNLRQYLSKNSWLGFRGRLRRLSNIASGLKEIHEKGLIHRDFHSGNILSGGFGGYSYVTDLGLCRPANEQNKEKVYGVMPYVAPEVLKAESYTKASDIYSFGIVAYELFSGLPPYLDLDYDVCLALKICEGQRPEFKFKIPQLLEDLIKKCWDIDPKKRPTTSELETILNNWYNEIGKKEDTKFYQQCKAIEEEYNKAVASISVVISDPKKLTSKLLPTEEVTRLLRDSKQVELEIPVDFEQLNLSEDNQSTEQNQQSEQTPQILHQPTPGSSKNPK